MPTEKTMKAIVATRFGNPNDVLFLRDDVPLPTTFNTSSETTNDKSSQSSNCLLVKVHACSLSPGDYRALLGDKTIVCQPKEWPYIPGGDICGTVVSVSSDGPWKEKFPVGTKIVSTWDIWGRGGLGQWMSVDPRRTVRLPSEGVTEVEGAALANSASHAVKVVKRAKIQEGDRVLVLGGSGGVGTIVIQLLKLRNCSYIATTSTDEPLMKSLGVDRVIDYTKDNFYDIEEFQKTKFDCIIDCAVGIEAWKACLPVIKRGPEGGRFVAVIYQEHFIAGNTFFQIVKLLIPPTFRQLINGWWTTPAYRMYLDQPTQETMTEVLELASSKKIVTILDPESPHPFTEQGVRDAWNKHISRKGHGKIVIEVE
jgi:NADPH:quinone reductase-like Zn-dependent oxidoreductase